MPNYDARKTAVGQTVLALGMNSSAKFTACVGEALRDYIQRLDQEVGFSYHEKGYRPRSIALFIAGVRAGPRGRKYIIRPVCIELGDFEQTSQCCTLHWAQF